MKKFNVSFVFVVLFAVFSACSGSAFAEVKIGYVDVAKLSESAPQIRSAQMKMDAEFGGREKEIIALQREIKTMEEAFERAKQRILLWKRRLTAQNSIFSCGRGI